MSVYLSQFNRDMTAAQEWLERNPRLTRAASEMCAEFNLRIAVNPNHQVLHLLSPEGIPVGKLNETRRYKNVGSEDVFAFQSPLIRKERNGAIGGKDCRDAKKITGIISSMKKNDEVPKLEKVMQVYTHGMRYAFHSVMNSSELSIKVDLANDEVLALLKLFIENDKVSVESHRNKYETQYATYVDMLKKKRDAKRDMVRFTKGSTAIGVIPNYIDGENNSVYYIVCDAELPNNNAYPVVKNVTRYNSLSDTPYAVDATIIRTYAQSKPWYDANNELGINFRDEFLPDIDVGLGYSGRDTGAWVIIPKQPREDV